MLRSRSYVKPLLIVAAVGVIGYFAYGRFFAHPGAGGFPGGAPPVSVAEVVERDVEQWNDFSGRLSAVDEVSIRPRVGGTIDSIHFKDGEPVKKGELLFTIDPRLYTAEATRAEGALASANAQLVLAKGEFDRAQGLLADKAISRREFDERRNALAVADAGVKSARAAAEAARLNLEYSRITAPVSGRAGRAEITVGNLVEAGPGAPVLTTIVSSNPIYADFEVDENSYVQYIKNGGNTKDVTKVPVLLGLTGESAISRKGRIHSIDNRVNTASGTIRARASFENADGVLVPGMYARIRLGSAEPVKAVLITDRAVGTDQSKKFVYVVGAENKVEYREVKLGAMAEGLRVVREGLKPGEKIIVNGLQRARPGAPITPEMVPMDSQMTDGQGQMTKKDEEKPHE